MCTRRWMGAKAPIRSILLILQMLKPKHFRFQHPDLQPSMLKPWMLKPWMLKPWVLKPWMLKPWEFRTSPIIDESGPGC